MIQTEQIKLLKENLINQQDIQALILYGSFARANANINSDIDLVMLINKDFNKNDFTDKLNSLLKEYAIINIINVELRNKTVVYFKNSPKIEIAFIENIKELERNYKGSLIPKNKIKDTILFDKSNNLLALLQQWAKENQKNDFNKIIDDLVVKFVYEFESASSSHARSDGYKFYYFYNIAFHVAVQLKYLSEGKTDYYFLPKKMTSEIITDKKQQEIFYNISSSTYLPNANNKKRLLLNLFYEAIDKLNYTNKENIKNTLEKIYNRDFLWNFRDMAKFNSAIKPNKMHRTSTLSNYQDNSEILDFLKKKNITTIIDLRAEHEIEKNSYKQDFIKPFKYIKAHLDPWNQPEWFKKDLDEDLTNQDKAYYFFLKACKKEIKTIFKTILETDGSIAFHCLAGKDRTGLIAILISMLTNAQYQEMLNDYTASEVDTNERKFKIYYDYVVNFGGIEKYLNSCEISDKDIYKLKMILRK